MYTYIHTRSHAQDFVLLLPSKIVTYKSGHDVPDGYATSSKDHIGRSVQVGEAK